MSSPMASMASTAAPHPMPAGRQAGFTLVELLVTMAITTVILGATMTAMTNAIKLTDVAIQLTSMNNGLRTSMDVMVRDMLQVGQALPTGNVILVPNNPGSTSILLPGPPTKTYYLGAIGVAPDKLDMLTAVAPGATGPPSISAVIPGPGMGPTIDGQPTDMIITLAGDSAFDHIRLGCTSPTVACTTALAQNGASMRVWNGPTPGGPSMTTSHGANITDGGADDLHPGDLIMLTRDSFSALVQVTSVAGQVVNFAAADSLNLNQQAAGDGTAKELASGDNPLNANPSPNQDVYTPLNPLPVPNPLPVIATEATRIRMITYYIDATTDPLRPRLVRRINNMAGTAVAFDIENLQITYDLVDGAANPANVRMTAADMAPGGRCGLLNACSPNQIRKVNIMLSARSKLPLKGTRQFLRNRLMTQVSFRSLAFVDRYQ
jgi:prepilin-type N-terminal cleavage/methylation domain-containing protein